MSAQAGLYHTENWSGKDTAIFIPLNEDTTLRVHSFDQITYPSGSGPDNYFIGDAEERYTGTIPGMIACITFCAKNMRYYLTVDEPRSWRQTPWLN